MKMHDGEVDIDTRLVERLVTTQFPEYRDLPVSPVASTATVNAIYRLGDRLYVRLPRVRWAASDIDKECRWLPRLAEHLSLRIPRPVEKGTPTPSYPFPWAIYEWIDGAPYADDLVDDEGQAAKDLAQFVVELRGVPRDRNAPRGGRKPLRELDAVTRMAIASSEDVIDSAAAMAAWERALRAPVWKGTPEWIHADLLRPNLLVHDGELRAVIDFGSMGVGDPAADVIPAWSVFGRSGRDTFRGVLDVDDGTWARARGLALHQAALIIPYYRMTNPAFVEQAQRTVEEVLDDIGG